MDIINNSWDKKLQGEFKKDYFIQLKNFLDKEYKNNIIYPNRNDIFNALKLTSYDDVKVVILGQDPYHGENQAHGMAFSVKEGVKLPPSLVNIYKEIVADVGCEMPKSGCLIPWAEQGVLLLNTVLTVREGCANSHKNIGWETFTDKIIELLNQRQEPIVFLLWGNNAKQKQKLITNNNHTVLTAPHPSPLSAYHGFFGCKHFSKTNEILTKNGYKSIDWQI